MISNERVSVLLEDLIRLDSVNPGLVPGGNGEAQIGKYIGSYMESMGLQVTYQKVGDGRANVIGVLKGTGGGTSLMLNGHMDTVDTKGMEIDPLAPVFKDGKVYGRGSYDMKGGLAAMIEAVHAVKLSKAQLKGDVVLACVCDEEYASVGTEAIAREYKTDAAIVCEPSDLGICVAHKGFAWIKVDVFGKSAHGSLPAEGIDAIMGAGKFLAALDGYSKGTLSSKRHPLLGSPSIHASLIEGGSNLSTYPSLCTLQIERRIIPGESHKTVKDEMEDIIAAVGRDNPEFQAAFDVFFYRLPFEISKDERVVEVLRQSFRQALGREPEYTGASPWLDSAILMDAGIPTVVFGPGGAGAHGAVEYVDFQSVLDVARTLENVVIEICG